MAQILKKGILFLNGEPPRNEYLYDVRDLINGDAEVGVYCTDGAYSYVSKFFVPTAVIGDFDSQDISVIDKNCEKITYNAEKDHTDGFLAVKVMAERGVECIDIYGAYGGRPDMTESNYIILALARKLGVKARFCGDCQTYLVGESFITEVKKGSTVSVVPYTDSAHILYMKGLKYELNDYTLTKLDTVDKPDYIMGVSNQSIDDKVEIAVTSGLALVFIHD